MKRKALLLLFSFSMGTFLFAQKSREQFLIIGTYTNTTSDGIYIVKFNTLTGETSLAGVAVSSNPSFLAISPNRNFVYAVNENAPGQVTAFAFDNKTGKLTELNRQPSQGKHPCYITTDKTGKWVIVGNYSSGTVAVFPVKEDGRLGTPTDSVRHEGNSVNSERQEAAHVHATVLYQNNKTLYVPDLGLDKVMIYQLDTKTGKLKTATSPFVKVKPGAGPRHIDIHPNGKFAYLIEELTGTVTAFRVQKDGSLRYLQSLSCLPPEYSGFAGSADIHVSPDGKFLYCSNRGESNSIGIFHIDPVEGTLTWIGHQSTLGRTPRNFNFDPSGNFLLVANQNSDDIVIFKRNKETGLLTDTGRKINIPQPVCLKWIPAE